MLSTSASPRSDTSSISLCDKLKQEYVSKIEKRVINMAYSSVASVVFVVSAAPRAETTRMWLCDRLPFFDQKLLKKVLFEQQTYSRAVSEVFFANASPSKVTSSISTRDKLQVQMKKMTWQCLTRQRTIKPHKKCLLACARSAGRC